MITIDVGSVANERGLPPSARAASTPPPLNSSNREWGKADLRSWAAQQVVVNPLVAGLGQKQPHRARLACSGMTGDLIDRIELPALRFDGVDQLQLGLASRCRGSGVAVVVPAAVTDSRRSCPQVERVIGGAVVEQSSWRRQQHQGHETSEKAPGDAAARRQFIRCLERSTHPWNLPARSIASGSVQTPQASRRPSRHSGCRRPTCPWSRSLPEAEEVTPRIADLGWNRRSLP